MELDADLHVLSTYNIEFQQALDDGEFDNGNVWNDLGLQMGNAVIFMQKVEKPETVNSNVKYYIGAAVAAALVILIAIVLVNKKVYSSKKNLENAEKESRDINMTELEQFDNSEVSVI